MKTLYIIRGLPGSGKSTYAIALAKRLDIDYFEADMFFTDKEGNYAFDGMKIGDAHQWCWDQIHKVMYYQSKSVVVSNTFTVWKEMENYLELAATFNYPVKIIQMNGKWQSIHGVPQKNLDKMAARFVDNKLLPKLDFVEYSEVY